jgi:outer membrane protein assembly factor BamA
MIAPSTSAQSTYETGSIDFKYAQSETFNESVLLDILLLPREKYFNRINLEEDLQRLNKYYFDNGFFDVIIDTATTLVTDDNEINIKFTIIENTRYTIRELKFSGLDKVTDNVKRGIAEGKIIKDGDLYSKSKINQERDRIISLLQNNGYFYAQIDTIKSKIDSSRRGIIIGKYSDAMQKNPEFRNKVLVRIRFIGAENIYHFGKNSIFIEANKYHIGNNVIERELKFKEGEVYNRSSMLESERNFTKLAIIQLGRVIPDSVDSENRTISTKVNITLNKKYELTPGLSVVYQSNRLFGGAGIEYKDKDFLGAGRIFTVGLEGLFNSIDINNIELSFSLFQPFLFNNNITATISTTFGLYNFSKAEEYLYAQNLLRLTYFISDHTFYQNAYSDLSFDYVRTRYKEDLIKDEIFHSKGEMDYNVNSIIGLTLIHNSSNNIFNPSKGLLHSITAESAGALPRALTLFNNGLYFSQYFKISTLNSFYLDISDGRAASIVATHFELGDIVEYGGGDNIQPILSLYKYYMGGGNSIRGWGAQKGGILSNPSLGGKFLLEGSIEWRRKPFPPRSFLNPVWGVLFLDFGNVWESDGKFRFDQIALATGFGIRYDTFIGPVRIDLGFKLYDPLGETGNKWLWDKPGDIFKNKYAIQFGLGNAF